MMVAFRHPMTHQMTLCRNSNGSTYYNSGTGFAKYTAPNGHSKSYYGK